MRVHTAVVPAAGMGTRFLPATKAVPKELLPILETPALQLIIDEAVGAGVDHMVIVTSRAKPAIEAYFEPAPDVLAKLRSSGREAMADRLESIGRDVKVSFAYQDEPLGLGHAVGCAREAVGDEPFAVLLPDDLMVGEPGALKQMVDAWEQVGGNLLCTEEVAAEMTASYGILTPGKSEGALTEVRGLIEKPAPADAPSRLAVIGRYILQPDVMRVLDKGEAGAGGEIQLTDAMAQLIGNQPFHALKVDAVRHDCGDKAGYVIANLALALGRDDVGPKVRDYLKAL